MRLLLFIISTSILFYLTAASCCTPECCCQGCTSCTSPITDRCNSYSCTSYIGANGGRCGSYNGGSYYARGMSANNEVYIHSPSSANVDYRSINYQQNPVGACKCANGQQQQTGRNDRLAIGSGAAAVCICPENQQGSVVAVMGGTGTRFFHKETCYGYDYCLLGLPGWVTIICSILLLLIFIILLFYCISCLVHLFII